VSSVSRSSVEGLLKSLGFVRANNPRQFDWDNGTNRLSVMMPPFGKKKMSQNDIEEMFHKAGVGTYSVGAFMDGQVLSREEFEVHVAACM